MPELAQRLRSCDSLRGEKKQQLTVSMKHTFTKPVEQRYSSFHVMRIGGGTVGRHGVASSPC